MGSQAAVEQAMTLAECSTDASLQWIKTTVNNHIQDSVPNSLKSRAIIPCTGTVVKSCRNGIKQLPSSNELDAQYVSPHQKPKRPHLQEKDMPVAFCRECHVELQMRKLQ